MSKTPASVSDEGQTRRGSYICRAEGRQVMASSHHDQTSRGQDGHHQETLRSTPDVEDLGEGNVDGC